MKVKITFSRESRFLGQKPKLAIYMRFEQCSYEEFYEWMERRKNRLNRVFDIGYSDQVIIFH